ncbi:unnamed protein product [Symbiodinium natans]|uniref:Uncharacterized protein n=1 Tax=Symbiodinium natans TaxID=878477 RepID=A0A812I5F6_9DINO|nr:unnamed protein product [Symbiodinium natans]
MSSPSAPDLCLGQGILESAGVVSPGSLSLRAFWSPETNACLKNGSFASITEEDKRHLRKADAERKKAEESLRLEVVNLERERSGLEQKLSDMEKRWKVLQFDHDKLKAAGQADAARPEERGQRTKRDRSVTYQPGGQSDTSSRRQLVHIVEVDLLQEDGPRIEEKDVEESDVSSTT